MNLGFCIKNFSYIKSEEEIDVSSLSPLVRRRLSLLDKATYTTMSKVWDESVENIVFSSQYGEYNRLFLIIEQYQQMDEVSPAQFSSSVHNAPVSFFTQYKNLNVPYYAVSSGDNSLQAGLIKSIISKKTTLFTYSDAYDSCKSVSCLIIPEKTIEYDFEVNKNLDFDNFIKVLEDNNKFDV